MIKTMTRFIDLHPAPADLAQLVQAGLMRKPRQLPAWLLYDAEGSRLFELICQQPEYSLTRTETSLLEGRAPAMAGAIDPRPQVVIEFGAGNARKVAPLLQALRPPAYAALDISAAQLRGACANLQHQHPEVAVLGVCCDYSTLAELPADPLLNRTPRLGFYPGSSLGNFTPTEAQALLRQMARLLGPAGQLLIGIDQPKAVERLEAAYNDAAGISAAFARNLLVRLNHDLDGDFDPQAFRYEASWDAAGSRIAMALISRCDQLVSLAGQTWRFASGEPLITEYSVKYSPRAFAQLAATAGWTLQHSWSDPSGDLSLHLLRQADSMQVPEAQHR
jgi:dimethylhistidine N-methyltransferase